MAAFLTLLAAAHSRERRRRLFAEGAARPIVWGEIDGAVPAIDIFVFRYDGPTALECYNDTSDGYDSERALIIAARAVAQAELDPPSLRSGAASPPPCFNILCPNAPHAGVEEAV
jgi:hypothetical protein